MQTPADGLRRVTREEMKLIDSMAHAAFGMAPVALMENAGREVAEAVIEVLKGLGTRKGLVAVFSSTGHNGGDGFVAARWLANAGYGVQALLVGRKPETMTHETAANCRILKRMGISVEELRHPQDVYKAEERLKGCVAVVDALLGTGFSAISGGVKEPIATAIDVIQRLGVPIVSADIPSGLDANTGEVIGKAVRATRTVTFGLPKVGFFLMGSENHLGKLTVADIGIPKPLLDGKSPLREAPAA